MSRWRRARNRAGLAAARRSARSTVPPRSCRSTVAPRSDWPSRAASWSRASASPSSPSPAVRRMLAGPVTSSVSAAAIGDRWVAWVANGCLAAVSRAALPAAEPIAAGGCPRAEATIEEGTSEPRARVRRVLARAGCLTAPGDRCDIVVAAALDPDRGARADARQPPRRGRGRRQPARVAATQRCRRASPAPRQRRRRLRTHPPDRGGRRPGRAQIHRRRGELRLPRPLPLAALERRGSGAWPADPATCKGGWIRGSGPLIAGLSCRRLAAGGRRVAVVCWRGAQAPFPWQGGGAGCPRLRGPRGGGGSSRCAGCARVCRGLREPGDTRALEAPARSRCASRRSRHSGIQMTHPAANTPAGPAVGGPLDRPAAVARPRNGRAAGFGATRSAWPAQARRL